MGQKRAEPAMFGDQATVARTLRNRFNNRPLWRPRSSTHGVCLTREHWEGAGGRGGAAGARRLGGGRSIHRNGCPVHDRHTDGVSVGFRRVLVLAQHLRFRLGARRVRLALSAW